MNRFSADVERYKSRGYRGKELWLNPAVWSIGCYRLGNWLHVARPFILIRVPLKLVFFLLTNSAKSSWRCVSIHTRLSEKDFTSDTSGGSTSIPRLFLERIVTSLIV